MKFEELLDEVKSPVRYLGREINLPQKDPEKQELKVVLAFPDLYEIGISHLGHRLLYHLLNEQEGIYCDRTYAPWLDMELQMRKNRVELWAYQTRKPLREFDLIGFTLANELCYSNVLYMLELANIPLLAEERKDPDYPIIIGGGPCCANPEPVCDFFDALFFGEAEEGLLEICALLKEWKKNNKKDKEGLIEELTKIRGVYVPKFFEPSYDELGKIKKIESLKPGYERVKRRVVPNLNEAYFPTQHLVPLAEAVHDRLVVEIARGCTKGCRFCQAGEIYRPYRERDPDLVMKLVRDGLIATGYEDCSLLSLSAGDYSAIENLISCLIEEHYPKRVSMSLPSLRINALTEELVKAIRKVKKTGFTLAPEAGTERLRKVINKPFEDKTLFETIELALKYGWRSIKLYFMVGLPTEKEEDIKAITRLAKDISSISGRINSKATVTFSVSGFIPKPHTPFQWEAQIDGEKLKEIRSYLFRNMPKRNLTLQFEDPRVSFLEGVFSRGDRKLSKVLLKARELGACFESWREKMDEELWLRAFDCANIEPKNYLRKREKNEVLPWHHLDSLVKIEHLLKENEYAYKERTSPDCTETGCKESCGVCDEKAIKPKLSKTSIRCYPSKEQPNVRSLEIFFRYLLRYKKFKEMRFVGVIETNRLFVRAVKRANLPIRYSSGFHPMPRLSFGPFPPVGVCSFSEYLELELIEHWPAEKLKTTLQAVLPDGIEIIDIKELSLKAPSINNQISLFEYEVEIDEKCEFIFTKEKIEQFMAKESLFIVQQREKKNREIDLRKRIKFMELINPRLLKFGVLLLDGAGVKPQEVVEAVFGMNPLETKRLRFTRTDAHFREKRGTPSKIAGPTRAISEPRGKNV